VGDLNKMIRTKEDEIYNRVKNNIGFEKANWYLKLLAQLNPNKNYA